MKLSPFLYFFQDPATVFAFHLIYTHNIIHWYLILILFFVYFSMASLLRNFTWNAFSKSRGFLRRLPSSSLSALIQRPWFLFTSRSLVYGLEYYLERALFWTDGLFELRDDPQSYLYYYYSKQLHLLQRFLEAMELSFTLMDEWALQHCHPNLEGVKKLTYEAEYLSAILSFLPQRLSAKVEASTPSKASEEASDRASRSLLSRSKLLQALRKSSSMEEEAPSWLLHKNLDSYLTPYLSRKYSSHSWLPHEAFLATQRGNDSLRFEYICVVLPTLIVFIILGHSLSLLYSGSEEITPGLHFTAVGHQWFWSYELEALIKKNYEIPFFCEDGSCRPPEKPELLFLKASFDSIPVTESALSFGSKRLLEVDHPLVLPVGVPLKALVTSGDVLHSWAVPEMALKIDAVPGRINDSLSFIQRPGIFYGQCSELCGVGHGFMPIVVEALDVPNFLAWGQQLESQ